MQHIFLLATKSIDTVDIRLLNFRDIDCVTRQSQYEHDDQFR
jgi:hypothetical protein